METSTNCPTWQEDVVLTKPGGSLAMSNDGKRLDQFYQSRSFFPAAKW